MVLRKAFCNRDEAERKLFNKMWPLDLYGKLRIIRFVKAICVTENMECLCQVTFYRKTAWNKRILQVEYGSVVIEFGLEEHVFD